MTDKADIAIGGLSVTADRENVVDFTEPFYESVGFSVLMKRKKPKTRLWDWVQCLSFYSWMYIIGTLVLTSVLIWIFDTWSPFSFRNCQEKYADEIKINKRFFTLKESMWHCFIILTPQGGGDAPKCFSAKATSAAWWLYGFIVIACYTANMAAFLALDTLGFKVNNFNDLVRQYKYMYGPVKKSSADYYFKRMVSIENRFYK